MKIQKYAVGSFKVAQSLLDRSAVVYLMHTSIPPDDGNERIVLKLSKDMWACPVWAMHPNNFSEFMLKVGTDRQLVPYDPACLLGELLQECIAESIIVETLGAK